MNDPTWYLVIQAAAAISTSIGVLIALYATLVREPQRAKEERLRQEGELAALNRAEAGRVSAQARKIVPSCVRTPMFGNNWWTVRVENISDAAATILSVDAAAVDLSGNVVPDSCQQANNTIPADQAFDRSIRAALSGSVDGAFRQSPYGSMMLRGAGNIAANQLAPAMKQAMQEALVGHFVTQWQKSLAPNQSALMAYVTVNSNYMLRITIDYEDEAGYQWRRTDSSRPKRIADDEVA